MPQKYLKNVTQKFAPKDKKIFQRKITSFDNTRRYSYGHGISSVILLSILKNLCSLSFIVIMTDIQNFCDRNSVTHNKNQNDTSNVCDIQVKNSNVKLEHGPSTSMGYKYVYKTCFTANVS
jgi:hypothetical protein